MVVPLPERAVSGVLLFGKLPAHGDFVSRGWAPDERDALDSWLSASLVAAKESAGEAFDERYENAPPWRFVTSTMAGALAPSQDAAGRRFPLLLAVGGGGEDAAEACETLLYEAIGGGWTADQLVDRAAVLADTTEDQGESRWWTLGGEGFAAATLSRERPDDLIATMLRGAETVS
ncbi:type VI secretion system-associated protein TagF [Sphingomonas endolithica]|uniref:type VI secretion system-associated protein TagF n=1 Tax=Sphingomonas endolithica TaxID=2972485 RepID=UPI0021AFDF3F|nr:type VI secretion system-associated protein TagF [Sphingomonas sp. ZFBP2030]